jgi:hypothetical protein
MFKEIFSLSDVLVLNMCLFTYVPLPAQVPDAVLVCGSKGGSEFKTRRPKFLSFQIANPSSATCNISKEMHMNM